jgi:hypothetical protein
MSVFSDALDNVRNIKGSEPKDEFLKKIGKTAKGSFAGLCGGLMIGWYYKKNLYVYGLIGTLVGGTINYYLFQENN